jgi:DNA-directed RNA polymerase specialized sigma24 family protein
MSGPDDVRTSATLLAKLVDAANSEAWQRFMKLYQPFIYAHCARFLRDHHAAEDMTGTVLLKIARTIKAFH